MLTGYSRRVARGGIAESGNAPELAIIGKFPIVARVAFAWRIFGILMQEKEAGCGVGEQLRWTGELHSTSRGGSAGGLF